MSNLVARKSVARATRDVICSFELLEGRTLFSSPGGDEPPGGGGSPNGGSVGQASNPSISAVNPTNNSTNVARDIFVAADVSLVSTGAVVDGATLQGNVTLKRKSDGKVVDSNVNTTGGGDAIVLTPKVLLDANTTYTFTVTTAVKDTAGRSFIAFTSQFTTGTQGGASDPNIRFDQIKLNNTTGYPYTGLVVGPDRRLYACTYDGYIIRYEILDNGELGASKTIKTLRDNNGGSRLITGLAFDPKSTATKLILWVSHGQSKLLAADDWTGKISKLTGSNLTSYSDAVTNIPRSYKDHLTNQLVFGPDGAIYLPQGSMTAMGAPDSAWGGRSEHLMTAAILRLDLNKLAAWPGGVVNARTEGVASPYDPFDADAPLTIYASGVRNAYDLVWTSDGKLYAPTNGSASGGNSPAGTAPFSGQRIDFDENGPYTGPNVPAENNLPTQQDYLFDIKSKGYYGHPNPLRDEYVLNGGNPTSGFDKAEVSAYPVGTQPDRNYRGFIWDFGKNQSANGIIEYNSSTFGGLLQGRLLVAQYSGGDNIVVLSRDGTGKITKADQAFTGLTGFTDPVDLIEDTKTGNIYVAEYGGQRITLLRPDTTALLSGRHVKPDRSQLVFNDVKGGSSSPEQTLSIKNQGAQTLTISTISLTGNEPSLFSITDKPTQPITVLPGQSIKVKVVFNPASGSSTGIHTATLRINSDATGKPQYNIPLRGFATTGLEGSNEPSLQRLMDLYQIPVNVGDDNPSEYGLPLPPETPNDELNAQTLRQANPGAMVSVEMLGAFLPPNNPPARVGWYDTATGMQTEMFTLNQGSNQTVNPGTRGFTRFAPTGAFGLYSFWTAYGQASFSQDSKNTWDDGDANGRMVRVYPLKNPDGSTVANAYVMGFEAISSYSDVQDVLLIIRNVKLGSDTTAPSIPTGLTASRSSAGVSLNWNDNPQSDIAGYNIRRSTNSKTGFFIVNSTGLSPVSSFLDDTVGPKKYYYRITAVDIAGNESEVAKITVDV